MLQNQTPALPFLNIAYFFRLIYDATFGLHTGPISQLVTVFDQIWFVFTIFSYLITLGLIFVLVYYSVRLYQIQQEQNIKFGTIAPQVAHVAVEQSRWTYIRELIESTQQSDWRNAIIEADIMLDEMLSKLGFPGATVGDKLKSANPAHFATLDDAWTAHRVRNDIAHQGSTYELSPHTAYQTIGRYENVFREFGEI